MTTSTPNGRSGAHRALDVPLGPGLAVAGVAIATVWAVFLTFLALFSDGRLDEQWVETLPWLAMAWMPAVLGAIGLRNPRALLAAGIVGIPLSFISPAGATLPLLIPSILYLVGYPGAARVAAAPPRLPAALIAIVVFALLGAAFAALVVHKDPRCWTRRTFSSGRVEYHEYVPERPIRGSFGSSRNFGGANMNVLNLERGCTNDRVTGIEVGASLALVGAAIGAGVWMSKPKRKEAAV